MTDDDRVLAVDALACGFLFFPEDVDPDSGELLLDTMVGEA